MFLVFYKFHDENLLCSIAREINPSVESRAINVEEIPKLFSADKATCVTGSLYLAGVVKKILGQEITMQIVNSER